MGNKKKVLGVETWVNPKTGEKVETVSTALEVSDVNFAKVWVTHLLHSLEVVGGAKMKVVNFILDNLNYSQNLLVANYAEIAKATKVSERTVGETIRLLRDVDFLQTRPGVLMVNPDIIAKGSNNKRRALLIKFSTFTEDSAGDDHED